MTSANNDVQTNTSLDYDYTSTNNAYSQYSQSSGLRVHVIEFLLQTNLSEK